MTLVIAATQERGPNGLPATLRGSLRKQNGDLMRDPEMIFEAEESAEQMNLVPYYWRNDYAGVEQYSAFLEERRTILNAKLRREHTAFAHIWDAHLKAQGFLEAFAK